MRRRTMRAFAAAIRRRRSRPRCCPSRPVRTPHWYSRAWRSTRTPSSAPWVTSTRPENRLHRGPLPRRGPVVTDWAIQRHRPLGGLPGQHAERHDGGHRPGDCRLRGDRAGPRRRGEQYPAGRACAGIQAGVAVAPGQPICHFGVTTGETCGTVKSVNNGWFTMSHGVLSKKGDSGGPVYLAPNGGPGKSLESSTASGEIFRRRCRGRPSPSRPARISEAAPVSVRGRRRRAQIPGWPVRQRAARRRRTPASTPGRSP